MASKRPTATCDNCAKLFEKKRSWQRFCNLTCQRDWHIAQNTERVGALKARIAELEQKLKECQCD